MNDQTIKLIEGLATQLGTTAEGVVESYSTVLFYQEIVDRFPTPAAPLITTVTHHEH